MIPLIRGFKDILPDEVELWKNIEQTAASLFENFGFRQIRVPVLEKTELFKRSIGEHTDIVEKEMYTFPGSKGELLTLRPEATASVVRSYIQQRLYAADPVQKLYTIGPMFRRERPQKGRYRQFHQINAEVFGIESPFIDAQLIYMLAVFFNRLRLEGLRVCLNSLGCSACRPAFREALREVLEENSSRLCSDCKRRKDTNPFRVLDCKVPGCREVVGKAPAMIDFLCENCSRHFESVKASLEVMGIDYVISPALVRGLDYYTRTAFEIQTEELGAQNAVAGGGRYDGLVEALGGPNQPAVGFAIGLDRLVDLVLAKRGSGLMPPDIYIAAIGDAARKKAFEWSCELAAAGVKTETDFSRRSLKALMKRADRVGAFHVLIVGDEELNRGSVLLRNMESREQTEIPVGSVAEGVRKKLA